MQVVGLARLGRDVEAPRQAGGSSVCNLSLAFSYGQKGQDGNRPTQWVDASLWGKQADAVHSYLMKGKLLYVTLDDVHIEEFTRRDGGNGSKLVGKVTKLEFAGGSERQDDSQAPAPRQAAAPRPAPAPAPTRTAPPKPAAGFNDMDDDIPF